MDIETRLTNLENLVTALSKKIDNIKFYQDADNAGMRQTENNQAVQIDANTVGVAGNEDAVCELSEVVDTSIAELEQAICDLSEEIGG